MSARERHKLHNSVTISVVTSYEQLLHAFLIRSICFMEEEQLRVEQAIDGNDFQATHMIAYDHDQPIGATRIRWFHGFAKIERTAFRPSYRDPRLLKYLASFVFDHVARKGYTKLITHAGPKFIPVWRRFLGFELVEDKSPLISLEYPDCFELIKHLSLPTDAITLESGVDVLYRVEGHWDTPTWLERRG